jgi:hypothetical protein
VNLWTVGCADPRLTAQARSPMDKAGENAMRFPRLAHRSAAAHKLHSTPQQDRMNLISGKGETSSRLPAFSLFLPGTCPNNRDRRSVVASQLFEVLIRLASSLVKINDGYKISAKKSTFTPPDTLRETMRELKEISEKIPIRS